MHRLDPISKGWGRERGVPIDRHYIVKFLKEQATDVRGRVLEVGDDRYTSRFGHGIVRSEIVDVFEGNSRATIRADLTHAEPISSESSHSICVETRGNVLAATAFLHGLSATELDPSELERDDPAFGVVILARAVK